ncbi:hypothetical protein RhiirA4_418744 [Rhizophagus irregularis]|uniref:Uncharacterized protein n=1 Tax=Rhizophagus irregularis TaxID=588596 RepID=A0A2I1GBQ6_9GLOM|nr:hypothetical protein RhiirA4_418744 [Rhizophagus irregularis]
MAFGPFGEYISDSEDENYPTWPCLNKKDDGSICGKRYCIRHYKSPLNKMCASCNRPISVLIRMKTDKFLPEHSANSYEEAGRKWSRIEALRPIHSQTGFRIMYKKNWLESRKKSE